jgi:D-glycerate 3-kinase
MSSAINKLIATEGLPDDYRGVVEQHWRPLADRIGDMWFDDQRPVLIGINGAQGSGKTTLCRFLETLLIEHNLRTVTLSLDDLYLTRAERLALAAEEHPLFATRGVPVTHDVALGDAILDDLLRGRTAALPRFDKAVDDRAQVRRMVEPPIDVVLFEGWCVGAVPQPAEALREPVNALERDEDADGAWRREVNRRLATDYAGLFARIDLQVMLEIGDLASVRANRLLQEQKLAASNPEGTAIMDEAALDRFLMHYERLTRWMLEEMPARADVVIPLGADQRPV